MKRSKKALSRDRIQRALDTFCKGKRGAHGEAKFKICQVDRGSAPKSRLQSLLSKACSLKGGKVLRYCSADTAAKASKRLKSRRKLKR